MTTPDPDDAYFKDWYAKHHETLNQSRRDRYKTDPEYRKAVLQRNREAREKRRTETAKERAQRRKASRLRVGSRAWKTVEAEVVDKNGKVATATLFTISALARSIGRSVQAVRLWERQGLLPEPPFRNKKGDRLYTAEMVEVIRDVMDAKGKLPETTIRSRPAPKGIDRVVRYADGTEEKLTLYRVGVLAEAIQRTVVTVQILEGKGYLPLTPFRASSTQYRLYSLPMIEAVKAAFEARGGEVRGVEAWESFKEDVRAAWQSLRVLDATFADPSLDAPNPKKKPTKAAKKKKADAKAAADPSSSE